MTAGATAATARLGTKSTVSTASVGAIGMPLTPPLDKRRDAERLPLPLLVERIVATRGSEAQATPLHNKASTPALFHPGRGPAGADRAAERVRMLS